MSFKRLTIVIALLLMLGFTILKQQYQDSITTQTPQEASQTLIPTPSEGNPKSESKSNSSFEDKLQSEVQKISQLQEDPRSVEDGLKEFSRDLKREEIKLLYEASLDLQKPQDERFLAIMLLSWTEKTEVAPLLENIAISEIDPYLNPGRKFDFEEILRLKAVEGLSDLKLKPEMHQQHLKSIIRKTSNSQVADRAHRALWASQGQAESPEKQDEEALKKILEKSSQ